MARASQKLLLLDALEDLTNEEFQLFTWYLQDETTTGSRRIPRSRLEGANRCRMVDQIVQTFSSEALEVSVNVFLKMNHHELVLRLTEVTSEAKVKTTIYQVRTRNTATHGGNVVAPNINNSQFNDLNITITNQVSLCGHMAEQSLHQTLAPSPERPLCVFPPPLHGFLNVLSGQVDADDLFLLSLKEQLKNLEPRSKSWLKLEIQKMIHEAQFGSDAPRDTRELNRRRCRGPPLTRVRAGGAAEEPRQPPPLPLPPAVPVEPQGVPGPAHIYHPSCVSWVGPEVSSRMDTSETPLPQGGVQEASLLDARASSAGSSGHGGGAVFLPAVRAPPPICEADPAHPATEAHFGQLYHRPHCFAHYPELATTAEGQNVDRLLNRRALPFGSAPPSPPPAYPPPSARRSPAPSSPHS